MFPAQALAEVLLKQGWRVKLSTDDRGRRYAGNFPKGTDIEQLPSATFARGGKLAKLLVLPRIVLGVVSAIATMRKDPPAIVVGFGGYPAIPAMAAAWILRKPRMLHEQNGVLGRVNQLFAKRVNLVACGTWPTQLPKGVSGRYVGNPVRNAILQHKAAHYTTPAEKRQQQQTTNIVVLGGSQGARILSKVVPSAIASLIPEHKSTLLVHHQAREEDLEEVQAFYRSHNIAADVQSFFHDVSARLAQAQLVIARSGASTVADVSVVGRPAIFVPLASAIRNEQEANARALVENDAAIMLVEHNFKSETLTTHIGDILSDPDRAKEMAAAALSVAKPNAAQDLADTVKQLASS